MKTSESDMELVMAAGKAVSYCHDGHDSDLSHDVWWLQDQSRFGA